MAVTRSRNYKELFSGTATEEKFDESGNRAEERLLDDCSVFNSGRWSDGRALAQRFLRRGEIPVLSFGRKKIVPKAVWDQKLGIVAAATTQ
jgi:hypothetical protein